MNFYFQPGVYLTVLTYHGIKSLGRRNSENSMWSNRKYYLSGTVFDNHDTSNVQLFTNIQL